MKKITILFVFLISCGIFAQKVPDVLKTEFSKEALAQKITSLEGKKLSISEVLKKHEGKV